jgi:outer membrane lipoprotein-sorting protein
MRTFVSMLIVLTTVGCTSAMGATSGSDGDTTAGAGTNREAEGDVILRRIAAAQAGRERVQGRFTLRTTQLDDPTDMETVYHVDFWLSLPDRYHLRLQDATDPEMIEWFVSDGATAWHAEQTFADEPPVVSTKAVETDEGGGFDRLDDFFRLDLAALRRDFKLEARAVEPRKEGSGPRLSSATRYLVVLETRADDLAEHLRLVEIEFDADLALLALRLTDGKDNRRDIVLQRLDDESAIDDGRFRWDQEGP